MSNVQKEILSLTFHRGNQITNFKIKSQSILQKKKKLNTSHFLVSNYIKKLE